MTLAVFCAVLVSAVMHASWNAMLKARLDRFASISLMTLGMGVVALPAAPFVAFPHGEAWFWIALSTLLHTGYRLFLIKAYEAGDLGQAYPLARGTAPLLTALGGVVLLGEFPGRLAMGGILMLSLGTVLMSLRGGDGLGEMGRRPVVFALLTSLFISGYTLTDGTGARLADAATYAVWLYIIDAVWTVGLFAALRGRTLFPTMAPEWKTGLVGGALSGAAYAIAMWGMTRAPIASVAALRESSILFALFISVLFLKERITRWRIVAALAILAGITALRLG